MESSPKFPPPLSRPFARWLDGRWPRPGLRGRFLVTYMLVILLVAAVIGLFVTQRVQRYYYANVELILQTRGKIVAALFERYLINEIDLRATAPNLAQEFAQDTNARVQILDGNGRVIGDSLRPAAGVNRSGPVQAALSGRLGEAILPAAAGHHTIEVALPIRLDQVVGVLVLESSDREIQGTMAALWRVIGIGTAMALVLVGLVSLWLGETLTEPIRELTDLAEAMADGNFAVRVSEPGRDEIGRLARSLNRMADELARLERIRAEFLAKVSHELKTPLTVIKGYVIALQDSLSPTEPNQPYLAIMERETDHLGRLVDDLLTAAKSRANYLTVEMVPVDVSAIVREVVSSLALRAREGGIRLFWQGPGAAPAEGDASRLREVFLNILDNAIKYTPTGGEIRVRLRLNRRWTMVEIRDSGSGIPDVDLAHIFEPYFRGRESEAPGTGLGLAIVREIMLAHRGRLEVRSQIRQGTSIVLRLPRPSNFVTFR